MRRFKTIAFACCAVLLLGVLFFTNSCGTAKGVAKDGADVHFKKTILTNEFVAEGATVADVNKDGKMDILSGTFWFEAPTWTRHEIQPGKVFNTKEYSTTFLNFAQDLNYDGWMDLIRVGIPGAPATWYENPKKAQGLWTEHALYHSVGNESPAMRDIDGDGITDLVCNDSKNKKMVWISAPKSATDTAWTAHIISNDSVRGTHMYTHGLGFGDMNADGREDVLMREGWWEAPLDRKQENWTFHVANLGWECSQMYPMDLDGDGDMDVVTASAHDYGMWWHEQVKQGDTAAWIQHDIYKAISQTHGMALVDVNGDGHMDLVTGKRYYAHNGHDPGAEDPSVLAWFEYKPGKQPQWILHEIDRDSGVGLHVTTQDMNKDGLVDIVIGNKKGVFLFEQLK
jgi:hypothetical protein